MTRKELTLSLAVIAGLFFTAITFTKTESYDCYQPMFSKSSTCSINGQTCILVQNHVGFIGLVNNFKGLFVEKNKNGTFLKCDPSCSIKLSNQSLQNIDSINHIHK